MKFEFEFEWDSGPDITFTIYTRYTTHIFGLYWSAYPVLGGKTRKPTPLSNELTREGNQVRTNLGDLHWYDLGLKRPRGGPTE